MKTASVVLSLAAFLFGIERTSALACNSAMAEKALATAQPTTLDRMPGVVASLGVFDPLELGTKANTKTLQRYREAEVTHGRVAMLAVVGILVGEQAEGSSFLFDASIKGPAIAHLAQVPPPFWALLGFWIYCCEIERAKVAFVDPRDVPFDKPGQLRSEHVPGDIGFDPLKLAPKRADEYMEIQTKELQNGRVAMIAATGFLAQELVNGKGIIENLV